MVAFAAFAVLVLHEAPEVAVEDGLGAGGQLTVGGGNATAEGRIVRLRRLRVGETHGRVGPLAGTRGIIR